MYDKWFATFWNAAKKITNFDTSPVMTRAAGVWKYKYFWGYLAVR